MAGYPWYPCSQIEPSLVARFLTDGFVLLRGVFDPAAIATIGADALLAIDAGEADERTGPSLFPSALDRTGPLWERSPSLRTLTLDQRLARIVCDLLHVDGVRVIGDDVFCKPPGGRETRWHSDVTFVPIDREQFVSVWIPFRPAFADNGAMVYAAGTHRNPLPAPPPGMRGEMLSHHWYAAQLRGQNVRTVVVEAAPGDVLVHHARTLHMAQANSSRAGRVAFGIHYVDARARLVAPTNPMHVQTVASSGWAGLAPGDELDVASAPVVFHRWSTPAGTRPKTAATFVDV